jgi:hypothetical protein
VRRKIVVLTLICGALLVGWALLLRHPEVAFEWSVRDGELVLYSDRPFAAEAGVRVLDAAGKKLQTSPLYVPGRVHRVFVCNSPWRRWVWMNKDFGAGGVAQYPVSRDVFLRGASVESDRLISPRGMPVEGGRTLDYFVAHEVTHQLTGEALGVPGFARLPHWVLEGYADYVAMGGDGYDYEAARRALLAGDAGMDWKRSGLYARYRLFVTYLLEKKGWSVGRLLREAPREEVVEGWVRGG